MATLRTALTQAKPKITSKYQTICPSASLQKRPRLEAVDIMEWEQFTLANLNASYGHVLDAAFSPREAFPNPQRELAGVIINNEIDIHKLLAWNRLILQRTLDFCNMPRDVCKSDTLEHTSGHGLRVDPTSSKSPRAHHVIRFKYQDTTTGPVMIGLGRFSTKWNAYRTTELQQAMAIRQLAAACREFKLRYGYIQTEQDLVVFRFTEHAGSKGEPQVHESPRYTAAFKCIPWSNAGPDELTTDLALWWLSMLAMSEGQPCDIVAETDIAEINEWEPVQGHQRG